MVLQLVESAETSVAELTVVHGAAIFKEALGLQSHLLTFIPHANLLITGQTPEVLELRIGIRCDQNLIEFFFAHGAAPIACQGAQSQSANPTGICMPAAADANIGRVGFSAKKTLIYGSSRRHVSQFSVWWEAQSCTYVPVALSTSFLAFAASLTISMAATTFLATTSSSTLTISSRAVVISALRLTPNLLIIMVAGTLAVLTLAFAAFALSALALATAAFRPLTFRTISRSRGVCPDSGFCTTCLLHLLRLMRGECLHPEGCGAPVGVRQVLIN
mmetsp:Transcript_146456/g.254396  ORF Transcript_146456/g.254396 Transcript_146456/m.254396 type:complete len:275 (+) Transcript_146456:271-1095(+)